MAVEQGVPPEWERWRGGVDTKLKVVKEKIEGVDRKVEKNTETLQKMPDEIEQRLRGVINDSQSAAPANPGGQAVTFKWLAERALMPVLLSLAAAAIGFLLAGGG